MSSKIVWMVAAGTGGHIFPGLAIAQAIQKQRPELKIQFFGTKDRLEEKIVPRYGYSICFLSAKQWKGKSVWHRLRALWALVASCVSIWRLIPKEKPAMLISVGGYVSFPIGLACWMRGVPIFLVEPNICAGISNKILSRVAVKAFTVPGGDALKKFHCHTLDTGNPVHREFSLNEIRPEAKNILILGGSQGARILCERGLQVFSKINKQVKNLKLVLQSGEKNLSDALELKKSLNLGDECELRPFIDDVPAVLAWADVVIARAGAMTLTELSLACVPTILVPFPAAADDHQRVNAHYLEEAGAAVVVDEKEKNFDEKLFSELLVLLSGEAGALKRRNLASSMKKFSRPKADVKITTEILNSVKL